MSLPYQRARVKMMQRREAAAVEEGAEVIPLSCEQRMEDLTNTINEEKLALGTKEARGKRGRTRSERTEKLHGDGETALSSLVRDSAEWRTAKALYRNQINHCADAIGESTWKGSSRISRMLTRQEIHEQPEYGKQ